MIWGKYMVAWKKMINRFTEFYRLLLGLFEKYYWIFFAAGALVLAFYCFRCLDVQYVDSWDEARHGVNAYEMIQNGDYIQHTYNYRVDDWNLKPSISYWGIVLGFKLFGYSVFGLRFTSAFSYLLAGIACALFARRYSKEASLLVLGFFCANERPLSAHLARAGDADSIYLLFFTLAMLAMLSVKKNHKNVYLCGLMFSLAFLTKSWHAGMIMAIGGICLLANGEMLRFKKKEWGGFLLSVFVPLILWFGWRFTKDGLFFLKNMIKVDLLARTGSTNFEGHQFPFSFYYDMVFGAEGFIYRWQLLICVVGILCGLLYMWRKKAWNRILLEQGGGILLWFLLPFLGFSAIGTKLIWYCYPCTVPLALGAAAILGGLIRLPLAGEEKDVTESEGEKSSENDGRKTEQKCGQFSGIRTLVGITATVASFVLVVIYMKNAYFHVIREAHGDPFQLFIRESVSRDASYAGEKAYVYVPGEDPAAIGDWEQNMLFVAEISGDFHCRDGGIEAFLSEKGDAVLYVDRLDYEQNIEKLQGVEVLCENAEYILLGH